jgi:hypothetical protein
MNSKALAASLILSTLFCTSCSSSEEPSSGPLGDSEQEKAREAKKATLSPFEGEHENLRSGDTAVWREGLELTISDVHIVPNQSRRAAEETRKKQKAQGIKAKKSLAEQGPLELVVFDWTVTNNGRIPVRFYGSLPCEALGPNGVRLPPTGAIAEEQSETVKARPLDQPLEPGQTREGVESLAPPTESTTFEIVCAHPPEQGGKPSIAQIPAQSKASWIIDVSNLEFRDVGGP